MQIKPKSTNFWSMFTSFLRIKRKLAVERLAAGTGRASICRAKALSAWAARSASSEARRSCAAATVARARAT